MANARETEHEGERIPIQEQRDYSRAEADELRREAHDSGDHVRQEIIDQGASGEIPVEADEDEDE